MHEIDKLAKYGLSFSHIEEIDLRTLYAQARPNDPIDHLFLNNIRLMINSPHFEVASLYYKSKEKKLKEIYATTRYSRMMSHFGKKGFPTRISKICDSVKKGYLRGEYAQEYITILKESFCITRYERDIKNLVPEVWSGHHRIGALLALGEYNVKVVVAVDNKRGAKLSAGKIHNLCLGGRNG